MTASVQQILNSFDALPENDKHRAAIEILRRYGGGITQGDLPEDTMVNAADALFLAMDADEDRDATS